VYESSRPVGIDLTDASDRVILVATEIEAAVLDLCERDKQDNGQQLADSTRQDLYSAVANLLGDVEDHPRLTLLKINQEIVDSLTNDLLQALRNQTSNQPWESMQALANLAIADDNKELICKCCLDLAVDVLTKECIAEPQLELYTCKLLVLHQDKLPLVNDRRDPLSVLFQRLEAQGQLDATRRVAAVGRFQLAGTAISKQKQETLKAGMQEGHIMLS
jgi:hypothetical protein